MSNSSKKQLRAEIARLEQELSKKNETIGRLTAPKKPRLGIKEYDVDIRSNDVLVQLSDSAKSIVSMLAKAHDKTSGFKVSQTLNIMMEKIVFYADAEEEEETITQSIWLTSKPRTVMGNRHISKAIEETSLEIMLRLENWIANGSNWDVKSVLKHKVITVPYNPLRSVPKPKGKSTIVPSGKVSGSSYLELPEALSHPRKGLVNIRNEDDEMCFLWCHVNQPPKKGGTPPRKNKRRGQGGNDQSSLKVLQTHKAPSGVEGYTNNREKGRDQGQRVRI